MVSISGATDLLCPPLNTFVTSGHELPVEEAVEEMNLGKETGKITELFLLVGWLATH